MATKKSKKSAGARKVTFADFSKRLHTNVFAGGAGARRSIGKSNWASAADELKARAAVDRKFGKAAR